MTAEPIARVVADLRAGRVVNAMGRGYGQDLPDDVDRRIQAAVEKMRAGGDVGPSMYDLATFEARFPDAKVIDASAIYRRLVERDEPVRLYEDHPCIAPPFTRFDVCYSNEHGNVIAMCAIAIDHRDGKDDGTLSSTRTSFTDLRAWTQKQGWEPAEPVDWDRVRWTVDTYLFVGGRGAGGAIRTTGPGHLWRFAIYDDGQPADLHWVQLLPNYPMEHWDMAHLVLLGAMNFLACRNVVLVEPHRDRAERRRLARTGVAVHELAVLPSGRTRRGATAEAGDVGTPLTSVRGHFASYGVDGKGLLFGKLAGRFWIPAHARGEREHGEHDTSYVLADDR